MSRPQAFIRSLEEIGFCLVMDTLEVQSRARAEVERTRARLLLDSRVELAARRQP